MVPGLVLLERRMHSGGIAPGFQPISVLGKINALSNGNLHLTEQFRAVVRI
jgi:hypothetical protein